jgi:hypothetical protein
MSPPKQAASEYPMSSARTKMIFGGFSAKSEEAIKLKTKENERRVRCIIEGDVPNLVKNSRV